MLKNREPCYYCRKYNLYEARYQTFLPPTILIDHSRDKPDLKFYHDTCVVRSLKKIENRSLGNPHNNHPPQNPPPPQRNH